MEGVIGGIALYYSDDVINEVLSRNDIVDVIGSYASLKRKAAIMKPVAHFITKNSIV